VWLPPNRQDLVYVGDNNHLYLLEFDQRRGVSNPWSQYDLIELVQKQGGTAPYPIMPYGNERGGSPLAIFPWGQDVGNTLVYMGYADGQTVIEAIVLDGPTAINLTQQTNTQDYPPDKSSGLAAYTWPAQQSQHVVYVDHSPGREGHVRELYVVGTGAWYTNDLSEHSGYIQTAAPKSGSPLAGYMFTNQQTEHVVYIAQDNTIRELYYTGTWQGNNLSAAVPAAVPPAPNSPLAAFAAEYENTEHVIYVNENGDVQELYYSGGRWQTGDPLNQQAGASQPAGNSALAGYAAEYEGTHHVVYVDADSIMHELYRSGGAWKETLLLQSAGSPAPPRNATPLAGHAYSYANNGTEHVIYIDVNRNVRELYREGNAWYPGVVSDSIPISH
jgi:hypothetical protein